jgi:uncharacterized membrane protein YfcA
MLLHIVIGCVLALALAGFVQGALGFGFGMVSMSLLPLFILVKESAPLVVIFTLPIVLLVFFAHWRHCDWRDAWLLIIGVCIGIPLGVYVLAMAPQELMLRILGAVLLIFSVQELYRNWRGKKQFHLPKWSGFPIGILSGVLGGAFNSGGPPLVVYLYSQPWKKEKIIGTLQMIFTVSAFTRTGVMYQAGFFTPAILHIAAFAVVPVAITTFVGTRILKKVPAEQMRSIVFVFIGLIALKFIILA